MSQSHIRPSRRHGLQSLKHQSSSRRKQPGYEPSSFGDSLGVAFFCPAQSPLVPRSECVIDCTSAAVPIDSVGPAGTGASGRAAGRVSTEPGAVKMVVPGLVEAFVESVPGSPTRVEVSLLDAGLATRGLVHGLLGRGWSVEVRTSTSSGHHRESKDERRRERGPENRERVERKDV